MKNVRFEIKIESQPTRIRSVNTEISDTLFPQYNFNLDSDEILKESKKHLKNAKMVTITILEYEDGDYAWTYAHMKHSVRFIERNYDGVEWEKRPMGSGRYPDRENVWAVILKDIYAEIVEYCNIANNLHIDNIRKL